MKASTSVASRLAPRAIRAPHHRIPSGRGTPLGLGLRLGVGLRRGLVPLALVASTLASPVAALTEPVPGLLAIRVQRAETIAKGTLEHAVILIENGKIVTIGEDLPIDRGIPVLDRPNWIVIPGLVNAYTRVGMDGEGGDDLSPEVHAIEEIDPEDDVYAEVLKYGETTLGVYPAGNGIPGQAVAIRPSGDTRDEMTLADPAYLKIIVRATANAKKLIRDGFKKADDYEEKEKKAREKWDKEQEKKKKAPAKKPDEKKEDKKDEKTEEKKAPEDAKQEKPDSKEESKESSDVYVPPEPDPKAKPFLALRKGTLRALVSVSSAAEYLHFLDAIGDEKFGWDLRIPLNRESDVFFVTDKKTYDLDVDGIGDKKCRVVMEPMITLHPGTMRQRNLPRELSRAGAKLVFVPRNDEAFDGRTGRYTDHEAWLRHAGELVGLGLDRQVALRAMTLEPAELLGVADRVGSLEKGKDANFVFLNGDPFEPGTRIQAVMLEGRIVHGEVKL